MTISSAGAPGHVGDRSDDRAAPGLVASIEAHRADTWSRRPSAGTSGRAKSARLRATRRPRRAEGVRQAIRALLAGVALLLATAAPALADTSTYVVEPGDTLIDIASSLGVTVRDLVRENDLSDADVIRPGQVLRLPTDGSRAEPTSRGTRTEGPSPGGFVWPLRGPITTYFGEPGPLWRRGYHPGLDIGDPVGTPVGAVSPGVVIEAESSGYNSGYGSYVKIDHGGGVHSLYGHLSRVLVDVGDQVSAGDVIGAVGMTGYTTGPHLHLEVRVNGQIQDPLRWLS